MAERRIGGNRRRIRGVRTAALPVPWLAVGLLAATVLLTALAAGDGVLPGDVAIATEVQEGDLPAAGALADAAFVLGGTPLVTAVALGLTVGLLRARRGAEAWFLLAIVATRAGNWLLKAIVDSPRPPASLVRVSEDASGLGFPSSHVLSAVLVYGSVIALAPFLVGPRPARIALSVAAAVAIPVTGFGRIYTGAHWPSDVLGGYLWGALLLGALLWGYRRRIAA